jgi:asparagine synthase (glutamine-hydrolysing)
MCGIAGLVDLTGQRRLSDTRWIRAMMTAIEHRGPDDEGCLLIDRRSGWFADLAGPRSPEAVKRERAALTDRVPTGFDVAMAQSRFSIIDLSPMGHQPLFGSRRAQAIAFNGEIYNYVELRAEIESAGVDFSSTSDTEVLLAAYQLWGKSCFTRCNGMWAAAIYDFEARALLLSRDRIGERPLYLCESEGWLAYASEIRALLTLPIFTGRVSIREEFVYYFLLHGWRDLGDTTLFDGITTLPAGATLEIALDGSQSIERFWQLPSTRWSSSEAPSPHEAGDHLRHLLASSVEMRLRADVPVALELSGGMDSSSSVALATRQLGRPVTTYTVSFEQREWNEDAYAAEVAKRYGCDFRLIKPVLTGFWDDVDVFVSTQEEPFHSPNLHTSQLIWRTMRAQGSKVLITGVSGDELFAGYDEYYWSLLYFLRRTEGYLPYLRALLEWSESDVRLILSQELGKLARRVGLGTRQGSADRVAQVTSASSDGAELRRFPDDPTGLLQENMLRYRTPYWLRSGDKTYMALPIEPRHPFLDHRVVEFAFQLPFDYLVRDGWSKWILRKSMEDLLPARVVWRRRKLGFPFPIREWLKQSRPGIRWLFDTMDNPLLRRNAILEQLEKIEHADPLLLWRLVSVELWHRRFIRGSGVGDAIAVRVAR